MSVSLNQYAKIYSTFENERTRPVFDLLAPLATRTTGNAIDLGCGPGNSTEVLQRFSRKQPLPRSIARKT